MDYKVEWIGGNCPVQADGVINGKRFYFRARGQMWSLGIGNDPVGNPEWFHRERYSDLLFAAGWMDLDEARDLIAKAIGMYQAGLSPSDALKDPDYIAGSVAHSKGEPLDPGASEAWKSGHHDAALMAEARRQASDRAEGRQSPS